MEYLLSGDTQYGGDSRFESFNTNIICWDVYSVTKMDVST